VAADVAGQGVGALSNGVWGTRATLGSWRRDQQH
jgi:hypothetical protein